VFSCCLANSESAACLPDGPANNKCEEHNVGNATCNEHRPQKVLKSGGQTTGVSTVWGEAPARSSDPGPVKLKAFQPLNFQWRSKIYMILRVLQATH